MRVFFALFSAESSSRAHETKNSPCVFLHFQTKLLLLQISAFNHRDEEGGDEEQQQTRKKNNADVESREGVLLLVANLFVALFNVHVVRFL